jgi:hypothetical protein
MWVILRALVLCYEMAIVSPLRQLYFYGPTMSQFGFWGGMGAPDICQTITPITVSFWQAHPEDCIVEIEKKFISFRVSVELIIYFLMLYKLYRFCNLLCWFMICRRRLEESHQRLAFQGYHIQENANY